MFDCGVVSMRTDTTTPDDEVYTLDLLKRELSMVRKAILKESFDHSSVSELSISSLDNIQLLRHPGCMLSAKKVASLSTKYFSIPSEYRDYYPQPTCDVVVDEPGDEDAAPQLAKRQLPDTPVVKKMGRPKKVAIVTPNQPSILSFLSTKRSTPETVVIVD